MLIHCTLDNFSFGKGCLLCACQYWHLTASVLLHSAVPCPCLEYRENRRTSRFLVLEWGFHFVSSALLPFGNTIDRRSTLLILLPVVLWRLFLESSCCAYASLLRLIHSSIDSLIHLRKHFPPFDSIFCRGTYFRFFSWNGIESDTPFYNVITVHCIASSSVWSWKEAHF